MVQAGVYAVQAVICFRWAPLQPEIAHKFQTVATEIPQMQSRFYFLFFKMNSGEVL